MRLLITHRFTVHTYTFLKKAFGVWHFQSSLSMFRDIENTLYNSQTFCCITGISLLNLPSCCCLFSEVKMAQSINNLVFHADIVLREATIEFLLV